MTAPARCNQHTAPSNFCPRSLPPDTIQLICSNDRFRSHILRPFFAGAVTSGLQKTRLPFNSQLAVIYCLNSTTYMHRPPPPHTAHSFRTMTLTETDNQLNQTDNKEIPCCTDAIDKQLKQFHVRSTPRLEYTVEERYKTNFTTKHVFIPINNTNENIVRFQRNT